MTQRLLLALTTTALAAGTFGAGSARAQQAEPASASARPMSPVDSLFRHARRMVGDGNGAAARALVDSLLRAAPEGTAAYGDALYWRGALAETAAAAELDYRRVIVEYPLAAYASDALLALAELEQARGDRAGALAHLQRYVREQPMSTERGIAALAAARLAFEQRDTRIGCTMLSEARASAASTDVELRNQIAYFASRCPAAPAAPAATAATVAAGEMAPAPVPARDSAAPRPAPPAAPLLAPRVPPARQARPPRPARDTALPVTPAPVTLQRDSVPVPAAAPSAASARGRWTIQLAAYNTQRDAAALVAKLAAKGVKARVSGTAKPFRVRLGYYGSGAAAQAEVAALKARGIIGFATTEEPRGTPAP